MTFKCRFCGRPYTTNARSITFSACCDQMRDQLEAEAENEAEARAEAFVGAWGDRDGDE